MRLSRNNESLTLTSGKEAAMPDMFCLSYNFSKEFMHKQNMPYVDGVGHACKLRPERKAVDLSFGWVNCD